MMGSLLLSAGALQAATPETIAAHTIAAGTEEHWTADKVYTLAGAVIVQGRLTIDAGTTILAEEGFDKSSSTAADRSSPKALPLRPSPSRLTATTHRRATGAASS